MKKGLCLLMVCLFMMTTVFVSCDQGEVQDETTGSATTQSDVSDVTESQTTEPGTTEPGTTVPDTSEPGTTEPETTEPGTTLPETTAPDTIEPGTSDPGTDTPTPVYSEGLKFESNGDGTCVLTGKGTCTDVNIVIPPISPDGDRVTSIGEGAFGATGLMSIEIPDSVTSIGDYAFSDCHRLTSIMIPHSVTNIGEAALGACFNLTSIIVDPENNEFYSKDNCIIKTLSNMLILGCQTSIIPDCVTSIGKYAFGACINLRSIKIPDSVRNIDDYAFWYCTGLTSIEMPKNLISIGDYAFEDCINLTSFTMCDGVTSIGEGAFGATGLMSIEIPDSVTIIGKSAFYGCEDLTSITIPDSVTSIGERAFVYCTGMTSITVAEGNPTYYSENNCIIEKESNALVAGCKNSVIVIPEGVKSVGEYAFEGCTGLTSIMIPDSVTSIGKCAFWAAGLTDVYYTGTEQEWAAISIKDGNEDLLYGTTIHYNYVPEE